MALSCVVFLLQTRSDMAQNAPASSRTKHTKARAGTVEVAMAEREATSTKSAETIRPSLDFYTKGVRGSMFSAFSGLPVTNSPVFLEMCCPAPAKAST